MNRIRASSFWLGSTLLVALAAQAASDAKAPVAFQIKKGFRLETVATEPLVFDPVALAFDADGRLFVAEDRDYPGPDAGSPHLGRVRLLEDTDGDGRFDTSKDFAEDLQAPSALCCWDKGVIVVAGMQVLHLKDTKGEGRADERRVLFTLSTNAPGSDAPPLPVRSLVWGLDNRIHAAAGGLPAVSSARLNGHDFAFDPRSGELAVESSFGSMGISFDTRGRKFVCAPAHPVRQEMWHARQAALNPAYVLPSPLADLTGPAFVTPIFPLRETVVPPLSASRRGEIGRTTEFFSAASSLLVYRGNAFPPAFAEDVFVADARANLIHRFKLRAVGSQLLAESPPDELGTEFLASSNSWFRPMQLAPGPDGAIYVADLHREFLDPPSQLPEASRAAAAQRRGNDQGRIYRIVPESFKQPPAPKLSQAKTLDLARTLAHTNGWHRDTAARLLCERNDSAAAPLLSNMLNAAQSPLARLHALAVLDGVNALNERLLVRGLRDSDERVRGLAIRLATQFVLTAGAGSDALWSALRPLAADPAPRVRYQLALAIGELNVPLRVPVLLEILRREPESPWTRAAVLNALGRGETGEALASVADDARLRASAAGEIFLRELALMIGTITNATDVAKAIAAADRVGDVRLAFALLRSLDEGLRRAGSSLLAVGDANLLRQAFQRALALAQDGTVQPALRFEAIRLLGAVPFAEVGSVVLGQVNPLEPEAVQLAAIETLAQYRDSRVGGGLAQRWGGLSARLRAAARQVLLAQFENMDALLDAVEAGRIPRGEFATAELAHLRSYPVARVRQRANALFGPPATVDRQEVAKRLQPALKLFGDTTHGRQVYLHRCAKCHRLRGEGFEFGPDLETGAARGKELVLTAFVAPNHSPSRAAAQAVETIHTGTVFGVIESETPTGVNLRQPYGMKLSLPSTALRLIANLEVSAMPEGLEDGLAPQAIADLLEHLTARSR